jgi:hypothetical protein
VKPVPQPEKSVPQPEKYKAVLLEIDWDEVDDEPIKFEKLDWVDEKTGKLHSRRYYSPIVLDKLK